MNNHTHHQGEDHPITSSAQQEQPKMERDRWRQKEGDSCEHPKCKHDKKHPLSAGKLFTYVFTTGGLKNLSVLCFSTVSANSKANKQLENTARTLARSNLQSPNRGENIKRTRAGLRGRGKESCYQCYLNY